MQIATMEEQYSADGRPGDEKLWVTFYKRAVKDEEASLAEGRAIFKEVDYIRIVTPGDKDNIPDRPVRDAPEYSDRRRFAKQFLAYQAQQKQEEVSGTPLAAWLANPAQVEELKYFGVHTVEQLAGLSDTHASKFMGINALRQKARDFIAAAKDGAPMVALRAEVEKRDEEVAALKAALDDQAKQLAELRKVSIPNHKKG